MVRKLLIKSLLASFAVAAILALSSTSYADTVVLEGTIKKATLKPKNTYILRGGVFITKLIKIKAGTTILGTEGSFLVINRGAQIKADGTRDKPIVFTSINDPGRRARGDWGGLIINGAAPLNVPGGTANGEGGTGNYGGNDPDDDSGRLNFVRVEYGGFALSPDNELNCIAFQGVGRGTQVDFVQAFAGGDDAFEWFGGTANAKHLVAVAEDDDALDWTFGWSGNVQFAVVQQRSDLADTGIEADNNENGFDFTPRANPNLANITLIGAPDAGPGSRQGMILRRGTAGTLRNFIVMGFKQLGIEVRDTSTFTQLDSGALSLQGFIFFNNGNGLPTPENFNGNTANMLAVKGQKIIQVDPLLRSPFDKTAPDFRPQVGSPALVAANVATGITNAFFEPANYLGAFDANNDWTLGWTKWVFGQ